ncbi:MAG: tetratricopeptide repeat protein [Candidatus Magnetominusculus sp. LBB02]|nr:tetratricopeptide repeat protein [Candidatus Magnetominusculus sp. LBB02]
MIRRFILLPVVLFVIMSSNLSCSGSEPKTAAEYIARGHAFEAGADINRAVADFSKAIEIDQKSDSAYYSRATAYMNMRDFDKAIADFSKCIDLNPKLPLVYYQRAKAYRLKAFMDKSIPYLDKAIMNYNKLIDMNPEYSPHYYMRCGLYFEKGDFDRALADCNKVVELVPGMLVSSVYNLLGDIHDKKGDHRDAIDSYSKAITNFPASQLPRDISTLYFARCRLYKAMNNDKAIEDCTKAIELATANLTTMAEYDIDYHTVRADLYIKKGEYDKAIVDLTKVLRSKKYRESASLYVKRASLYDKKKDHAKAIADYIEAALLGDEPSKQYLMSNGYKWPDILPEVVLLGDSITYGADWSKLFPGVRSINKGIPGDTTCDVLKRLDKVIALKPKKIFIMVGINDMAKLEQHCDTIGSYQKIINTLSDNLKDTKIYVQSILPIIEDEFPKNIIDNMKIIELNKQLQSFVTKISNANISYVDLHKDFVETGGNHLTSKYTIDGCHLNKGGFEIWRDKIQNYVLK